MSGDPADFDQKWFIRDGAGELAGTRIMGLSTESVCADSVWVAPEDEADSENEISEDDDLSDITSPGHQAAAAIRQQIDIGGQAGSTASERGVLRNGESGAATLEGNNEPKEVAGGHEEITE